jgi:hypothetical protein
VGTLVEVARTPFSSRIRQGFVCPAKANVVDWTERMRAGSAGVRANAEIRSRRHKNGNVMYGPHVWLEPGHYRLSVHLNLNSPAFTRKFPKFLYPIVLVALGGRKEFARKKIGGADLAGGVVGVEFEIKMDDILQGDVSDFQLIMWTGGLYEFSVKRVEIQLISPPGDRDRIRF